MTMVKFHTIKKSLFEAFSDAEGRRRDLCLGSVFLLFSLILIFWLIPGFVTDYATGEKGLSPRFFPYLVAVTIALLSSILIYKTLWPVEGQIQPDTTRQLDRSTIICVGIFMVYQQSISIIGFIPASFLALISLMVLYGFRNWLTIAIFSVALITVLSFFFEKVAQVPLPRGLLWDWLF
jgi:hypothetical protein